MSATARHRSSGGQFFRAGGRGAKRGDVNAQYGGDPGSKSYTWISDQHGQFHILPMGATEDEAIYAPDGLYRQDERNALLVRISRKCNVRSS